MGMDTWGQSPCDMQLRGKTWTAPAPNNLKYNLINVRRNIR